MPSRISFAVALTFAYLAVAPHAPAQDPLAAVRPYDGIQAGLDAYRLAEEQRRAVVDQQIVINDQLRYWNGYPASRNENIYSETIYYGYMSPAVLAAYGYSGYGPWTGFELGPWMGSGLWPTPYYYPPARQPIGQQQIQTGPNRWESHPVYAPPLTTYRPSPPVDSLLLDRTPYATATTTPATTSPPPAAQLFDSIPPPPPPPASAPAPLRGPREY